MRKAQVLVSLLLLVLLLVACAPKAEAPAPAPQAPAPAAAARAPAPAAAVPAAQARPAWQLEWERVQAEARREGRVVMHTGAARDTMAKIARMQGIEAEILSMRTPEYLTKVFAERRAGLYLHDLGVMGISPIMTQAKPAGILEPLDSALILPDLTDPETIKKVWYQGQLPWVDQEHMVFMVSLQVTMAIAVNTDLVKPEEIKSWRDVLDPKWRGKLLFYDPVSGAGYGAVMVQTLLHIMGEDYLKALAREKPIITRDKRQVVDWLVHGKVAIAIAPPPEVVAEFIEAGARNIKPVMPQEGSWLGTGGVGNTGWFKNAPHPNAAKVFLNGLLSKEGQELLGPAAGVQSTREDVSTTHLLPGLARVAGVKYFASYTAENLAERDVTNKLGADLFGYK